MVHQILVEYTKNLSSTADVMETEGAVEVLDHQDHKVLREQQEEREKKFAYRKSFNDMWKEKKQHQRGAKKKVSYKKVGTLPSVVHSHKPGIAFVQMHQSGGM